MVSIFDALLWIISQLYISMYPVGDDAEDLSLGFGDGGDISPSPMAADIPLPRPPTQMSASYLFTKILTDKGMLINIVAVVCALLIGVQALLGSRRRRLGSNAFVRLLLWVCYTISFPVVSYTIGLVQSVEAKVMPDSQLLWAVVLLLLLGSVNGMSAFSRQDIEQSKGMLANHFLKTMLVLWLLFSRSNIPSRWVLLAYFLLCWIYSIFRMAQRMTALRKASSAHGLVCSAVLVADYMEAIVKDNEHNPKNINECKYLVHGEEKDFKPPSDSEVGPPYLTKVGSEVVTVDMIWKHTGKLLRSGGDKKWDSARALKDTCLSFALFKLLRRRFCGDLSIAEAGETGRQKAMEFVVDGLLADDRDGEGYGYERAFHVVELELSFLYDFFYTQYPVLFPTNRLLGFIRFLVLAGFVKVLLVDFIFFDGWLFGYDDKKKPENTFIYFNNVLLIVMILSIDILQHLATGYSNWAVALFVCDYVNPTGGRWKRCWKHGFGIRRALIKLVAAWRWKTGKWWSPQCWDNKLGQYSLLKSYDYNPCKKNALSWLSMRMMEPTGQGRREETAVPLTDAVKKVVLDCLKETLKDTRGLPCVGRTLKRSARYLQLHWACDDLPTHTHTVLVWHIATSMCEMQDTGSNNSDKHGHSHVATTTGDDSDDTSSNNSDKHGHRHIATTLSGYCAYLLAFVPDMLPDNSYKARQILDAVVEEVRNSQILDAVVEEVRNSLRCSSGGSDYEPESGEEADPVRTVRLRCRPAVILSTPKSKYGPQVIQFVRKVLRANGQHQICFPSRSRQQIQNTRILTLGAELGKLLLRLPVDEQWELLARFWAELVLFLAPSNKADVHAEHLATGGEFITHLWALLSHAGIVERPLYASPA